MLLAMVSTWPGLTEFPLLTVLFAFLLLLPYRADIDTGLHLLVLTTCGLALLNCFLLFAHRFTLKF